MATKRTSTFFDSERFKPTEPTRASTNRVFGTPLQITKSGKLVPEQPKEDVVYRDWKNYENYLDKYIGNLEESIGTIQCMLITAALRRGRETASRKRQTLENAYLLHKACRKFKFKYETYFMALFLAACTQANTLLQLGVCLFMSDKYEEMYAIKWQEIFEYLKIKTTTAEVIEEELTIFKKMNFTVHRPLLHFLTIQYLKSSRASEEAIELANQVMKVILLEEPFFRNNVSDMAVAICSIVLSVFKTPEITLKFNALARKNIGSSQVTRYRQSIMDCIRTVSTMKESDVANPFIELAQQVLLMVDPKPLKASPLRFATSSQNSTFSLMLN